MAAAAASGMKTQHLPSGSNLLSDRRLLLLMLLLLSAGVRCGCHLLVGPTTSSLSFAPVFLNQSHAIGAVVGCGGRGGGVPCQRIVEFAEGT